MSKGNIASGHSYNFTYATPVGEQINPAKKKTVLMLELKNDQRLFIKLVDGTGSKQQLSKTNR